MLRLLLPLLLCVIAWSQSKDDLKEQLEAAQREKAALLAALARAQAGVAAERKAGAASREGVEDNAIVTASINAEEARRAARVAAEEAAATRAEQAANDRDRSRNDNTFLIVQISAFMTFLVGLLYKAYSDARQRKWDKEDAERKHHEQLEAVKAGAKESAAAIEHSNNLTQKIVDMREDLVAGLQGKSDK